MEGFGINLKAGQLKKPALLGAVVLIALAGWLGKAQAGYAPDGLHTSKHNLSTSGPGPIKAATETRECIFCHTPHNATDFDGNVVLPLWNHQLSAVTNYALYGSTTLVTTTVGQPTGPSRLCLSCHDGSIAVGAAGPELPNIGPPYSKQVIDMRDQGSPITTMPIDHDSNLTTDLSDDHPISFTYDTGLYNASNDQLEDPSVLTGEVALYDGKVECTTCHDPHDNSNGKFLVVNNADSSLCLTCHTMDYWVTKASPLTFSAHKTATNIWDGFDQDPWTHTDYLVQAPNPPGTMTVDLNACENCHRPHTAEGSQRLLNYLAEEDNCLPCHNGNVAAKDVEAEFQKTISHPIYDTTGVHDPMEDMGSVQRHVECVDCHNQHAAQIGIHDYSATADSSRNEVSPALIGVPGVEFDYFGLGNFATPAAGNFVDVASAAYEYEICFKCHTSYAWGAGSPPDGLSPNGSDPNPVATDVAQEFNPNNRSGHPVVTGMDNYPNSITVDGKKGLLAAAMKSPWNSNMGSQTMMCSDCHNTDASSLAAQGPHGSAVQFMLRGPNSNNWPDHLLDNFTTSWCANCHQNNAGDPHDKGKHRSERCYVCHIVIPHGGKISRLIADHDTMPPRYAYNSTLNPGYNVTGFNKKGINNYNKMDCRAGCSGKHSHQTPSENW